MDTFATHRYEFSCLLTLVVFFSLVSLFYAAPMRAADDFDFYSPGVREHVGDLTEPVTIKNNKVLKLLESIEQNPSGVDVLGPVLKQFARSYTQSGEFEMAERILRSVYRAQQKIGTEDRPLYFKTLAQLSKLYLKKQDFDACIENHEIVRTGHEKIGAISASFMRSTLYAVECQLRRGDVDAALGLYDSYSRFRDKYSVQMDQVLGKADYAYGTWLLGKIAFQAHYDNQAEELFLNTLSLLEEIVGTDPMAGVINIEGTQHMPLVLADISRLYSRQGRFTESKEFLERAMGLGIKVFDENSIDWWDLYLAGGYYYENLGDLATADEYYVKAAKVIPIRSYDDSPWLIGISEPQARIAYATGRYDKAEIIYDGLLTLHRVKTGRESYPYASTLKNLALVYAGKKEFVFALITLSAGKMIAERVLSEKNERLVPFLLAESVIRSQMGELDMAMSLVQEAQQLALLDSLFRQDSDVRLKEIQSRMIAILNVKNGARHVYMPSELAVLNPGGLYKVSLVADSELGQTYKRWDALIQDLENIKALIKRELTTNAAQRDPDRERELLQRKDRLTLQSDELYELLKEGMPEQNLAANFANYQSRLKIDEALVAYQLDEERMTIVLVKNDGIRLVPSAGNIKLVRVLVDRIMRTLDQSGVKKRSDLLSFDAEAAWELYKIAFQPVEKWLNNTSKVFVVRSGALQRFPMGLMMQKSPAQKLPDTGGSQWLIDKYVFVEIPDMSFLHREQEVVWADARSFAGFGHPLFEGQDDHFSSLPNTVTELLAVAEQLDVSPEEIRTGKEFTREKLLQMDLSIYDVLSFSTHALTADQAAKLQLGTDAGLLASTDDPARLGSGFISASTIQELEIRAQLVMLAACNTGVLDEFYAAASMSQLAESFLDAGARSVLVSMWSVDSTATTLIVARMFEILNSGNASSYADALRQAAIWLRDNKDHSYNHHPTFWGGFTLINDIELVNKHEAPNVPLDN